MALLLPLLVLHLYFFSLSSSASTSDLATCLLSFRVHNFSIPSSSNPSSSFLHFLNFSIQNLRFAAPSLPKPLAVVLPSSPLHLRHSILCCRQASVSIRLRSAGHSYEGLSYLSPPNSPFAVIDLMNLNQIKLDPSSRTAWVEAGATLGETYHAIASTSPTLGFSAGSCPTVGSGGHIAGGGFGLLSRKYGLAADNVVDAILIDSKGRILDRKAMGEDVFWAIRGGGGGTWGAVYAWRIQLLPVPETVTGFILSRPGSTGRVASLVHKWEELSPSLADEFYLSVFVGAGLPEMDPPGFSATFKGFYLGPKSEAIAILNRSFKELGLTEPDCREMSWIESVVFFSGLGDNSTVSDLLDRVQRGKKYFKAKSDYVRTPISKQNLTAAFDLLAQEAKAYVILDPYGGAMSRITSEYLPFPHRTGNLYAIQYMIEWTDGEDWRSESYMNWLRAFYDFMRPYVSNGPRAAYVNYLDLDLGTTGWTAGIERYADPAANARVWGEKYFLGNYDRLVRVKSVIDPDNVFNNPQSIPPSSLASQADSGESSHAVV